MTMQFHCPSCHALLSTETSNAGSIVSCADCHKDMLVPHVSPPIALPVPTIPVVPAVPLLKITCPSCGITGEIADRGGPTEAHKVSSVRHTFSTAIADGFGPATRKSDR